MTININHRHILCHEQNLNFHSLYAAGHGKFETLGALGISGMLLVTAGGIAWHAADILLVETIPILALSLSPWPCSHSQASFCHCAYMHGSASMLLG